MAQFTPDGRVLTVSAGMRRRPGNPLQRELQRYPPASIDPPLPAAFNVLGGGSSSSDSSGPPQGEELLACLWNADTGAKLREVCTTRRGELNFPYAARLSRDGKHLLG